MVLYEKCLLNTIPREFNLKAIEIPQECPSGSFYSKGWNATCYRKVELFYQICKENLGNVFAFFDVDIQFFGNVQDVMLEELGDFDIACQDDLGACCSGQFICKASPTTLNLFELMLSNYKIEDQTTLNNHISVCKYKYLSKRFFTFGHAIPKQWQGEDFDIPKDILTHHANWVVGVENKLKIVEIVREKYNRLKQNG